jgi:hypothetical protein
MPIKNNYVEASELTRRKRLTAIKNANKAADATKFRALTTFDSYDPSYAINKHYSAEVCNDSCRVDTKPHNITSTLSLSYKNVNRVG